MSNTLLDVTDLCAFYGPLQVLFGVSLSIERGDLITLVGRNGAGRSTLAKAIVGRAAAQDPSNGWARISQDWSPIRSLAGA